MPKEDNQLTLLGIITKVHGINGEIIIKSFTDDPLSILKIPIFFFKTPEKVAYYCKLSLISRKEDRLLRCKISISQQGNIQDRLHADTSECWNAVKSRTDAEKLVKNKLYCLRHDLPDLKKDEFYISDLKDLPVLTTEMQHIGVVSNIYNFGAGDIIEIKFSNLDKLSVNLSKDLSNNNLFPFKDEYFPTVTPEYIIFKVPYDT